MCGGFEEREKEGGVKEWCVRCELLEREEERERRRPKEREGYVARGSFETSGEGGVSCVPAFNLFHSPLNRLSYTRLPFSSWFLPY